MSKNIDTIEEVGKFNPYHDSLGRFSTGHGAASFTVRTKDPNKQHWADMAIARAKGEKPGAATKPVATKAPEKRDYKTLNKTTANEMRHEMGQSRTQIGETDYKSMVGKTWGQGYFQTSNSFEINEMLRDGVQISKMPPADQETIKTLDKHMKPSTQDIKLHRMADENFLQNLGFDGWDLPSKSEAKSFEGKVFENKGYSSTSYDGGKNVFNDRPIQLNINAPKGTKMLISPTGEEAEVLLARSSAMKITKSRINSQGKLEIDVEVLTDSGVAG